MGEIIGVGLISHVPTIMLPKDIRYELNDGKEISIVTGMQRIREEICLLYTSPSPRDRQKSRMPSSA